MKINYSQSEFENAKSNNYLSLICYECENTFLVQKKIINRVLNKVKCTNVAKYCSIKCQDVAKYTYCRVNVECKNCNNKFIKYKNQVLRGTNHFCSKSCAATYNNTHKTKGTRVSKLEIWLKEQLTIQYPDWIIKYNEKETINSELDIHIPHLNLAFELNGIFHYEPIYGEDKLKQIKNNDDRKFQACLEKGIELVIIDTSSMNYWKPIKGEKYLNIILNIINKKIK